MTKARLMNHDTDKEIEILLQCNARRAASIMSGTTEETRAKSDAARNEAHMDADELSAYAEGALPERARSRYSAHLADCDSCRKIVTELVISSNVASSLEAAESGTVAQTVTEPKRSLREWLATLFSPPVLRFAVPALALLVITAIVFIVATRRSADETSLVAKNEPARSQPASSSVDDQKREASSNATVESSDEHGNNATANTRAAEAKPGAAPQQTQPNDTGAAAPPPPAPQEGVVASNPPKPAAAPVTETPAVAQERKEAQPSTPAMNNAPADKVSEQGKVKDEELAIQRERNEAAAGGAVPATAGASANDRRGRTNTESKSTLGAASKSADDDKQRNQTAKSLPAARSKRDAAGAGEDSTSTPTRTVAGKRFRQQNGIWVDNAYNSSRSLTTVRRGTEQYRALVADEPIIATVSNELGNCIIVVKGRAYHVY